MHTYLTAILKSILSLSPLDQMEMRYGGAHSLSLIALDKEPISQETKYSHLQYLRKLIGNLP